MSRRRTAAPWAATSVPVIRRQWCNALEAVAEISFDQYKVPPPPNSRAAADPAAVRKVQRLVAKFESIAPTISAEAKTLRGAELYWVSRDMVDVVRRAAGSLPEWTPAAALPSPVGLLCWARSAGTVSSGLLRPEAVEADLNTPGHTHLGLSALTSTITELSWDGVWWWDQPENNLLQLVPFSRQDQDLDIMRLAGTTSPVWAAQSIFINRDVPRTEEATGSEQAHPFISAVGAAWLLMAEANVTQTRVIGRPAQPLSGPDDALDGDAPTVGPARAPSTVTLVELRARAATSEPSATVSGRGYTHRFPVTGHWRQQAYGPNHSWRKPRYIGDYIKGPEGAPLIAPKPRVHVLRKGR